MRAPSRHPSLLSIALAGAVVAAIGLAAPTARAELSPERIVSLESDPLPGENPLALSGLTEGQILTRADARQAIRAIWATGRVSDVRVLRRRLPGGGIAVRLQLRLNQVVRGLEIDYVDVEDDPALERQDVARAVGYFAGMAWQPEALEQMIGELESAYRNRGYPDARAEGAVEAIANDPEAVTLRLRITEGTPVRLQEVTFRGQLGLEESALRHEFPLKQGDVYDRVVLDDGITKVLELYRQRGYLEAKIPLKRVTAIITEGRDGPNQARLLIPVTAGDHYTVDFVGNRYVTDEELLELIRLEEEEELTRAILDSLAGRLRDHYRSLGFFHARADWRITRQEPGERRLTFRIRRGPRVTVTDIEFTGNEHFSDRHLRRQVVAQLQEALGEQGLFRQVSDDMVSDVGVTGEGHESWRPSPRGHPRLLVRAREVYLEEVYTEARAHITELYAADGYLNSEIAEPELTFRDNGRLLTVSIAVNEGPRTMVRSITYAGNTAFSDDQIQPKLSFTIGGHLDRYEIEQARRQIIRAYREEGYIFVAVQATDYVDEDFLAADIYYEIDEGPQVRVGEVLVRGNDLTRTALIRDRININPGDIYTPQASARSERGLIDLGIFTTASVNLADPDVPAAVKDVIVEVAERRPQSLELRGGFSTADGPRLGLRYGHNNLFGIALGAEMRIQGSYQVFFLGLPEFERFVTDLSLGDRLERLIVLSLHAPHIPRLGQNLDLRLDATHERDNDPAFAVTRYGVTLTAASGYRPWLNVQLQTGFTFTDVVQVQDLPDCQLLEAEGLDPGTDFNVGTDCLYTNPTNRNLARAPQGSAWFWVTRAVATLDLRDNPFNTTRGFFTTVSGEHVYSLAPARVLNNNGTPADTTDDFTEEYDSNLIKFAVTLNGYIPLGFLNWVLALQVRFGWIFELTRTSFTFPDRFFYLGGFDSMRGFPEESMNAEDTDLPGGNSMLNLRAELRIPLPSNFAIGVFFDTGNLWREQVNLWRAFDLRMCVGAGLRFNTPVGPLALDGAILIDRRAGEAFGAIQFAIGLF